MVIYAQETSIVKCLPQYTQGYLVFTNTPNIKYWDVEIIKRVYNKNGTYESIKEETFSVIGKNYAIIPVEHIEDVNHYALVTAFNEDGTHPTEEVQISECEPGLTNDYILTKTWLCNGKTYAYDIQQYVNDNGGSSHFKLQPTAVRDAEGNFISYYYQYFSVDEWNTLINTPGFFSSMMYFHNLPANPGVPFNYYYNLAGPYLSTWYSNDYVHTFQNTSGSFPYHDKNNVAILTNPVIGLRKQLGPWCGYPYTGGPSCIEKEVLVGSMSASPIDNAIMIINNNAPILEDCEMPELECNPTTSHPSNPVIGGYKPHLGEYITIKDSHIVIIPIYFSIANNIGIGTPEDPIIGINLTSVSGNNGEIFSLPVSDLIDIEGNQIIPKIPLSPGLYRIGFQTSLGEYIPIIVEYTSERNTSNNLSNFLTASIFPVPIYENSFSINFTATKDLNFRYILGDFYGNSIYETDFKIASGASETVKINPKQEIPDGILTNTFIFEDGSQLTFITVKQK